MDNLNKIIDDIVLSYVENIDWDSLVGEAAIEVIDIKNGSEVNFTGKLVEHISEHLKDAINTNELVDEIVSKLNSTKLTFQQTPSINGGGYLCDKCYRGHGIWVSSEGHSVSDTNLMVNGKNIIVIDDLV